MCSLSQVAGDGSVVSVLNKTLILRRDEPFDRSLNGVIVSNFIPLLRARCIVGNAICVLHEVTASGSACESDRSMA